jgi:hypothetical protein
VTARDSVSLPLVRYAHEDAAALLVPAVLAGSGDGRGSLALSESARAVNGSPSDIAGWVGVSMTARTARRIPPSASLATDHSGRAGALRIRLVADDTGTNQDLYSYLSSTPK